MKILLPLYAHVYKPQILLKTDPVILQILGSWQIKRKKFPSFLISNEGVEWKHLTNGHGTELRAPERPLVAPAAADAEVHLHLLPQEPLQGAPHSLRDCGATQAGELLLLHE